MNYTRFLNRLSLARQPSPIRVLTAIVQQSPPTMISMAGGMPNAATFPIDSATFKLRDGTTLDMSPSVMKQALQYSPTPGQYTCKPWPNRSYGKLKNLIRQFLQELSDLGHQELEKVELIGWVKGLQEKVHKPPALHDGSKHDLLITNGSQDGICKAFEAMVSPGDNVLIESPTYSGTLAAVKPMDCNLIPLKSDGCGLDPGHLQQVMSEWRVSDINKDGSDVPKVLYLIPNGGNPTGHGLTEDRKREIYKIAQHYNLLILEDDPYFYLQFKKPYVPSLLSMDIDGRVIRFDSFSKLISSGMRLGCVTGPKPVLDRISLHMQASVLHASGMSQVLLLQLLKQWGYEGFEKHADNVTDFYRQRKDQCIRAAEKHLTGLAEWSAPTGGMFLWLKLNVPDTYKMITVKAREKEVLFVPGNAFQLDDSQPCQYVRASYSMCTVEQMDKAFERLAELIREEQRSGQ